MDYMTRISIVDSAKGFGHGFDGYLNKHKGDAFVAAKDYYKSELQGKTVTTKIGIVRFNSSGWSKFKAGTKKDIVKAGLIDSVIDILQNGEYVGHSEPYKNRSDNIVRFHFFQKEVASVNRVIIGGVTVAEKADGSMFYNVTHIESEGWIKREQAKENGTLDAADGIVGGFGWKEPSITTGSAKQNIAHEFAEINASIFAEAA